MSCYNKKISRPLEGRIPMDAGTVYELILPFAVSLFETLKRHSGGTLHTFVSSLHACDGPFMFQGIILLGDASGLTPAKITHTNGVGAQVKRVNDVQLCKRVFIA